MKKAILIISLLLITACNEETNYEIKVDESATKSKLIKEGYQLVEDKYILITENDYNHSYIFDFENETFTEYASLDDYKAVTEYSYFTNSANLIFQYKEDTGKINYNVSEDKTTCESTMQSWCDEYKDIYKEKYIDSLLKEFDKLTN